MTLACPARLCIALATTLAATGLLAQGVGPETVSQTAAPVERLIIQYKDDAPALNASVVMAQRDFRASAAAAVTRSAGQAQAPGLRYLKSVSPRLHVARLDRALPAREAYALMERLRADPAVASVTADQRVWPHALPTDPYFTNRLLADHQWHLQSSSTVPGGINATQAWVSGTGTGVVVAVLDGGYRPHADLAANLLTVSDHDFISDLWIANDGTLRDTDAQDPGDWVVATDPSKPADCPAENSSWHGTHVSGLIGALANATEGVGVAYGAQVLPVRVLGRCGGFLSDIQEGMRWAAGLSVPGVVNTSTPARVLNLSLGVQEACDSVTQSVVDEIRATGVSVVASSGNEGMTAITKPANCMGVVAVTAHTRGGAKASYANVGPGVALSAPGGDMWDPVASTGNTGTTVPGSDAYTLLYGTSMAAPQAAGALALMASARPDLSLASLEALMRGASRPFPAASYCGRNPGFCGSGLLDAGRALAAADAAPANAPDLEVLQRLDSGRLGLGEQAVLTVHVRNWGATTATGVQITAAVTGLDIQSVSANLAGTALSFSSGALSAVAGDLAADAELVLTVTARVTASDGYVTSEARATSSATEVTLVNNEHRLVPAALVPVEPVATADSGGGCTVAAGGQADMGLPLLLLAALLGGLWRRRAAGLNALR
jgi:serine protease